jgi:hypothetical protein
MAQMKCLLIYLFIIIDVCDGYTYAASNYHIFTRNKDLQWWNPSSTSACNTFTTYDPLRMVIKAGNSTITLLRGVETCLLCTVSYY